MQTDVSQERRVRFTSFFSGANIIAYATNIYSSRPTVATFESKSIRKGDSKYTDVERKINQLTKICIIYIICNAQENT